MFDLIFDQVVYQIVGEIVDHGFDQVSWAKSMVYSSIGNGKQTIYYSLVEIHKI